MTGSRIWGCLGVVATVSAACTNEGSVGVGPTANVAGTYTLTLRYGENGCLLDSWTEDSELAGVVLELEQSGVDVIGTVPGVTGAVLGLLHGSNVYEGTVEGARVTMTIFGNRPESSGNCVYSLNNEVDATFDGDFVTGTLLFARRGNGNPDCPAVECESVVTFNGTRPPE